MNEQLHLSRLLGAGVFKGAEKVGSLRDLAIVAEAKIPEVTYLVCARPFGAPPLFVPWKEVASFGEKEIRVRIGEYAHYIERPGKHLVLLSDHILDKKVVDMEDREVEVVYDIGLVSKDGKLYATEVDISRYGLLCRLGLRWLAQAIYKSGRISKQTVPWSYIQPLGEGLDSFRGDLKLTVLRENLSELPTVDLADILEALDPERRVELFNQLDTDHASDTLEEIDPNVQRDLVSSLKKERVAELIDQMTPAQAADTLSALPLAETQSILPLLDPENAGKIKSILDAQEQQIVNFATTDVLKVGPDESVAMVIAAYREASKNIAVHSYAYVTDTSGKLLGLVGLKDLVLATAERRVSEIMQEKLVSLGPENTLREAAELFNRYGFRALPVTDAAGTLLGAIPYRDIMKLKHRFVG